MNDDVQIFDFADTLVVYAGDGVWTLSEDGEAEYAGSAADLFRARIEGRPVVTSELPNAARRGLVGIMAAVRGESVDPETRSLS